MGTWPHDDFKVFFMWSKCPLESLIFGMEVFSTEQQREECATLVPSFEFLVDRGLPLRDKSEDEEDRWLYLSDIGL
jgi:hypothetical protein